VVGISGGVDSAVALALLQKKFLPIAISLKIKNENFSVAQKICEKLKIPHQIIDTRKIFEHTVLQYFWREIKKNRTPNPCVFCNPNFKFAQLFEFAEKNKIKFVATGHFAKIFKNEKTQKFELHCGRDAKKDQTYFLHFLPQKFLARIIFPLENFTKKKIFEIAAKKNLNFWPEKKESQNFCFLENQQNREILLEKFGENRGEIRDENGKILGEHRGLHFFTIGQRRGIPLNGGPFFVAKKCAKKNILFVTKNKKNLLQKKIILKNCKFIDENWPPKKLKICAKMRAAAAAAPAEIWPICEKEKKMELIFSQPQIAPTPGQFAVFYQKKICIGGGEIF